MEKIEFVANIQYKGVFYRFGLILFVTEGMITELQWFQLPCDPDTGEAEDKEEGE